MKITAADLFRQPDGCILRLSTDSGVTGIAIGTAAAAATARRLAKSVLVGADPRAVTGLWQQMTRAGASRGDRSRRRAAALLDLALWDLKARANREPLWRTLGGARPRAHAYASCAGRFRGDDELSAWFRHMASAHGLHAGKLTVGRDDRADQGRIARMRDALSQASPYPELMIDAERRWSADQAVRRLRAMERRFDLVWVEGIARASDARGLKRVSDSIAGAVCVGAGFAGISQFLPHLRQRSADVVQIDIGAVGITAALQIADAAYGLELPVTLAAVAGNIHAQVAGVMPNCMSVEIVDPDPPSWLASDLRVAGGRAIAGDLPGNGLRLVTA
ncbi:MAG: enolase C-terminal domain-like protein [Steroidobacteraceae bacterium]